ncbi:ATP-grasp domain-containing protein [Streptomyces lydicus]|uniref:ATP-grasp domain-containing protein n=1 Tax=Streptomyces lydicus TaxID=47763 RepID=UPI0036E80C71
MSLKSATSPLLIVLGAGERDYECLQLQQLAAEHPVLLLDPAPQAWTWPYAAASWAIDLAQEDLVADVVASLAREGHVAGVTTYMEHHVPLAARLAEDLHLPSPGSAAMQACRDKVLTRRMLVDHHVPSARSFLVDGEQAAVECARSLGYPVVVKPRAMAGSAGVMRADSDEEVRRAVEMASGASVLGLDAYAVPGVLVEEYLDGEEISAECVVLAPQDIRIVAITRKRLGPEPRFLEAGQQRGCGRRTPQSPRGAAGGDARDPGRGRPARRHPCRATAHPARAAGGRGQRPHGYR